MPRLSHCDGKKAQDERQKTRLTGHRSGSFTYKDHVERAIGYFECSDDVLLANSAVPLERLFFCSKLFCAAEGLIHTGFQRFARDLFIFGWISKYGFAKHDSASGKGVRDAKSVP